MSIHEKTMLITLTIKCWSAAKKDIKATREVHEKHNAKDAGIFRKHLIDPGALKPIQQAITAARTYHYQHTLPWDEQGARILTTEAKPSYDLQMRILKDDYFFQVEQFLAHYPEQIDKARTQLNGLFKASEYPEVDKLRRRFQFKIQVAPVPHVDDFRINLAQEDMSEIKADLANQLAILSNNAQRDLWLRLHDAIGLIKNTLNNPDRRWVKNTFTKLNEMAEVITRLNYTGNAELNALALKAKNSFADLDLNLCKSQPESRKAAASEAEDMLAKIAQFI